MSTITSEIKFLVELDENRVPEKLTWTAQDGGVQLEEAKAMLLSIWDGKEQETLRIDLWTKDMPVDEMKIFIHQSLVAMADTYERATNDEKMSATMRDFKVFIKTKSGRCMTITAISTSTIAAMVSVTKAMGEMPARITGRPA
jgi:gliding motility-associated protein GldC